MSIPDTAWPWPWWTAMVVINVINMAVCVYFYRESVNASSGDTPYLKRMRIMGLIFTVVALYRSIFVSRYLYQYGWFDTIANSSLLIRGFAWAAELSFSGLIALAMLKFNADVPDRNRPSNRLALLYGEKAPYVLIACIFIAQFCATGGLITKSRLLFAIEETLWSLGFLSILPLAAMQFRRVFPQGQEAPFSGLAMLRTFAVVNLSWCIIYCSYGLIYHLPTEYWASALQQIETGIPQIRTGPGAVRDALGIVNVTHNYADWGFGFVLWHSAYFSVCVWLALFMMRAPRKLNDSATGDQATRQAPHQPGKQVD